MKEVYDVIVVGAGAAGVGAAVGAAQAGAKTLLVECGPCLGGAATQKNVLTYCGFYTQPLPRKQAVGGVAEQVLTELQALHAVEGPVRLPAPSSHVIAILDTEGVKLALDRVVTRAKVQVLLHTMVVGGSRNGDSITAVTLQDDRGPREVSASAFVDASGEGDLAAFGGASVRYGNQGIAEVGTMSVRIGGIAPNADRSGGRWAQAVKATKAAGASSLDKEDGLVLSLPISGDLITYYVDATYNALDGASITAAEITGREKACAYLKAAQTIPGYEKAYIVSTGPKFGTRESRHVNAQYQITEADITGGTRHSDVVALGAWPMEYHPGGGEPTVWKDIKDKGTFDIPLRTLMSVDTRNLFSAGRLADGDSGGGGAIRVMGTSFATGHAAGVSAAHYARTGGLSVREIQAVLREQGALIDGDNLPDPLMLVAL